MSISSDTSVPPAPPERLQVLDLPVDGFHCAGCVSWVEQALGEVPVVGMHCAACVSRVEKAMVRATGVLSVDVGLATETARVRFVPGLMSRDALREAVEAAGYQLRDDEDEELEDALARRDREREEEYRDLLRRFWVGVALGAPVALIGHAHLLPGLRDLDHQVMRGLWMLSGLLTIPTVL